MNLRISLEVKVSPLAKSDGISEPWVPRHEYGSMAVNHEEPGVWCVPRKDVCDLFVEG